MNLRLHLPSSRPPPRWLLTLLAVVALAVLSLGRASTPAGAGIADYPDTLYLSAATSTTPGMNMSRTLVTSAGTGTPTTAPIATLVPNPPTVGMITDTTAAYEYTIVDSTGGETLPSPPSNTVSASSQQITVSGLPTGVTVRLYRKGAGVTGNVYKLVTTLTSNASSTYTDNAGDATLNTTGIVLPATQNKPATFGPSATGYFEFVPGVPLATSAATSTPVVSRAVSNKGWVVDAGGGVSIPTGNWTFLTDLRVSTNTGTAFLDIGMWLVDGNGNVVSQLVDPTTCSSPCGSGGENTATNISRTAVTSVTTTVNVPGFTIPFGDHLYVQYWRDQTMAASGTTTIGLLNDDGATSITHPTANAYPDVPALGSVAARVKTTPQLSATFTDPDAADTGTLSFQLCSDPSCATVLQSGSSAAGLANGATGTWTPAGLADGTYYWHVQATDSFSGATGANVSGWSGTSSFVVDTVPPGTPTLDSPAAGGRANTAQLGATFVDTDLTDSGTVDFQLCSNASCSAVVASSTSATVAGGTGVSWTPTGLADGTYYWRLRATDVAGNQTASWTPTQSLVLDTNPPGVPSLTSPADASYLGAAPALKGTFTSGDAGDSGKLDFQVCTDNLCGTVVQSGSSSSGLGNGATGSWTPSGLADGAYFWRSRAQDAAGNQSAWSAVVRSFTLDTTAPTAPGPASVTARAQTPPQLSATYADPGATDTGALLFRICSNGGCTAVVQSHTASSLANNATVNWTPSSLADGLYYYAVTATDTAGNASTSSGSFTVDTTAPAKPALVSPAAAGRMNAASIQLNATFTDSDPTDSGTVTFELCSDAACATVLPGGTGTSAVTASGGSATVTLTPTSPLTDGTTYYWRASSLDAAGNQGAWSSSRSFVVDTNPPTMSQNSPADGARVGAATLKATFSSTDAGDSGSVSFQVCSDVSCATVVASGSSSTGLLDGATGSWTATGLADGVYYWRASATDAAGNHASPQWTSTRTFTLDTSPPAAPTTTGSLVDAVRLNQPPTLTAIYNDPSGGTGSLEFELCATSSCTSPILTNTGTTGSLAAGATGNWKPAFLFDGLYFWRVRSVDSAGNTSAWSSVLSFSVDATPPEAPVLSGANGMRVPSAPALTARVSDPTDPGDEARIFVEICSDATCTTILANGYSGTVPVGTLAGWQAPDLGSGTYYWRALAEDVVGNRSEWSAARTFVVDTVPPDVPLQGGVSDAALVSRPRLSGTFSDVDPGDSGTLEFQVCTDADCTTVVAHGSSAPVAAGQTGSWTAVDALDDGVYFWRVRAVDAAGNPSAWSSTRSFTLDQTPPGRPQDFSARITGHVLTLRWRPPAGSGKVRGYALIVNGKKKRTLDAKTLKVKIHLLKHDKRSFAVAAIDPAGNMSAATRTIATFKPPLSLKQARSAAARRG